MKKKKSLLIAGLSVVSACSLAFAFGCSQEGPADEFANPADDWVLQSIELDVSNIKLEYNYNELFDASQKPAVTATYATLESVIANEENKLYESSANRLVTETRSVSADDIKVDYSQYDQTAVGIYNIYVSYTHAGVTRSSSYQVEVKSDVPGFGGITAVTADGFVTEYVIENADGIDIDLTGLAFHTVNSNLEVSETAISSDAYTLEYFCNGTTKVDNLNGIKDKGTYTILATYENEGVRSKAFVAINVLNPITGFDIKDGYKNEQVQSPVDELTSTWQFTVTYSSGKTVDLKKGDAGLIIGNPVTVTAAERSSKVTYTEDDEIKELDIAYTITKDDKLENEENALDKTIFGVTKDTDLKQSDLKDANEFLTKGADSKAVLRYRPTQDSAHNGALEIRYNALQVEFKGFGSLMVSARSTGSSNTSSIALKDANGNFITALYDANDEKITAGTSEEGKGEVYAVSGDFQKENGQNVINTARILTFIIPEPGVYTLCTVNKVTVGEADIDTGRNTRIYKIEQVDVFDATIDRTSYGFEINTDNVKKDYIAGQTEADLSKEGLTAVFKEIHSVDDTLNKETPVSAENLSIALTAGDMSKLNTTGTVTVTYTTESGKEYKATYTINIKSPVTGVNSVVLSKETVTYTLESATATLDLNKNDIVLRANSATGDVITIGEGDSVTYQLFKGEQELTDWTSLGEGTYTVKATVVLKNTEAAVPGTTTFVPANLTITIKPYVPAGEANPYEDFFIPDLAEGATFAKTDYGTGAEVTDNTLFTINASVALESSVGGSYGQIQHNGGSHKVQFTDTKNIVHNPNIAIKQSGENLAQNGKIDSVFTVTANENIKLYLYLNFGNDSHNSDRAGAKILYSLGNGVISEVSSGIREANPVIQILLNKGEVLTVGVNNTSNGAGKLWLYGAEAEKQESAYVPSATYTVTYHINSEEAALTALTLPQAQVLNENGKATEPEAFPAVDGWSFGGWYTDAACTGTAYDFNTAVTANVDLYAKWTAVSTATVTFDANGHGTAPAAMTVNLGETVEEPVLKVTGWKFEGWYTEATEGTKFDFATAINGNTTLYAHWTEITYPATFTSNIASINKAQQAVLTDSDFVGANAFLTVTGAAGSSVQYRTNANGSLDIRGNALAVTFTQASGKLSITFMSTGGSNTSGIAVLKADGTYLAPTTVPAGATKIEADTTVGEGEGAAVNKANLVVITGQSAVTIVWDIEEAGTYTIFADYNYLKDDGSVTGRGTRVTSIVMNDGIAETEPGTDPTEPTEPTVGGTFTYDGVTTNPLKEVYTEGNANAVSQEELNKIDKGFLKLAGGTVSYNATSTNSSTGKVSENYVLEIRGDALTVTFSGTGTLTIQTRSTGNTNKSAIGLKDAAGNYITATYADTDTDISKSTTDKGEVYVVSGSGYRTLTFNITEAGTYTIFTINSVTVDGDSAETNTARNTRIGSIVMVDNVEA